ncbi:MAG: hypothetical protein ACRDRK_01660 [Pseudonocardia sp.]
MGARAGSEHSGRPLTGYKLAHPMVSADGTRAGFGGVTLGRGHVYETVAEAVCVQGGRHRCPSRWCDCGFYCVYSVEAARGLACDPEYAHTVLLDVAVSGRYIRYEKGLRYQRQRVRSVRVGRCGCARAAELLVESGTGTVGWRAMVPTCRMCAGSRPVLMLAELSGLLGDLPVSVDPGVATFAPLSGPDGELVPVLAAEVALLQARLDEVQAQLDQLTRRPS